MKQVALETFAELQAQGDENVVDINQFTSKVQAHIIVSQLVGAQYCFKKLPHIGLQDGKEEQITVGVFMDRILNDIIYRMTSNPLISMHESFAEKEIFAFDTRYVANARTIRNYIRSIIEDKKKLNDPEACDIVSLLLADENYKNIEEIIDDVLVLFIAGSKTVQTTTSNLICTMLHEPEQYKKLRETVDPFMSNVADDIMDKMTMESVEEMEYVKLAYMETMRRDSPAQISSTSCMTKDMKIGGVSMYANEALWVGIQSCQKDPA